MKFKSGKLPRISKCVRHKNRGITKIRSSYIQNLEIKTVIFHSFICVKLIFLGSHSYVICHLGDQIENKSSTVLKIDPCL